MSASKYLRLGRTLLAVGLTGVMLSACGTAFQDDPTSPPAQNGSTGDATEAAPPTEDITITYWSAFNQGEPQQEMFDTLAADFTADTGIEIDVRYLGRQVTTNLVNALGTGTGPDLYDLNNRNLEDYTERGFVANLEDVLDMPIPNEDTTVRDVIAESVVAAGSNDEGLAIMPANVTSNGMWFNATRFPEFKENPPATWDEFIAVLDEVKAEGGGALGVDGSVPGYNVFWLYQSLLRLGGPGALRELGDDAENWNKPHVLEAAKMVEQLVKGGYFQQDYMGTQYPAAQVAWANNEYAFMLNGSYMGGETTDLQAEDFEAYTFVFPMVEGGIPTIELTTAGYGVNADSENLEAVKQFLAFSAQKQYQEQYPAMANVIPARQDVEPPASLVPLAKAINEAEFTTRSADGANGAHPVWWTDVMLPLDDEFFGGGMTAEEFVAQGYERTAEFIASNS